MNNKNNVFVVDDDPSARNGIARLLRAEVEQLQENGER